MNKIRKCAFCGIEFSKDPPTKPECMRFVDVCWSCADVLNRAAKEACHEGQAAVREAH